MDIVIVECSQRADLVQRAVEYFWGCWGSEGNYNFYRDCILNSQDPAKALPKFYLAMDGDTIAGSYALLTNDLISRQDLWPWFACLYVQKEYRRRGLATRLLEHGLQQARMKGFDQLYLYTDLVNFYEKTGWKNIAHGYTTTDQKVKIYSRETFPIKN